MAALVNNHASLLEQADVEGIAVPSWFNFSGPDDPMINPEQRQAYEEILDAQDGCGHKYFPEMQHGWYVRPWSCAYHR